MSTAKQAVQAPPPKPPVLAVQNVKGGVGKTTIAVNLAALLAARHGKRVLLIDADPQCNASLYLLDDAKFKARVREDEQGKPKRSKGNLYDVFHGDVAYLDVVTGKPCGTDRKVTSYEESVETQRGALSVLCASPQLFEVQEMAAEIVVSRIESWIAEKHGAYDHVIIDCSPSISSLSLAALKAADKILVPMLADQFSIHGLPLLLRSLSRYRDVLDIEAAVSGVVLSMFPPKEEITPRARAEQYARAIAELCSAATPPTRCLTARISRDQAYPDSFVRREPLPLSNDPDLLSSAEPLIAELAEVASELGLNGDTT